MYASNQYIVGVISIIVIITTKCQVLRLLLIKEVILKQLLLAGVGLRPINMRRDGSYSSSSV